MILLLYKTQCEGKYIITLFLLFLIVYSPDGYSTGNGSEPMDQVSPANPSIMRKRGYEQTNGIDGIERV